ncbi:metallophosphoesterase [Hymenobacter sp. BT730]|uniref:metallophosphoesterase family protein n=1 Tax=Hymenobacter sp. BT730 TaxID=3063332 RepID=UPI0026E1108F|nr:metallophosphoesterase [Hymenobacter sp. BT730]
MGGALVAGSWLMGCSLLESSPNQAYAPADEQYQTSRNLARLAAQPPSHHGDTVRFVLVGDSQRFYDETEDFVASVNQQPRIDFVAIAGDISDFGLGREMHWIHRRLQKLHVPYLTVIGNHDELGNGRAAYQKHFGPLNYSFVYQGTRFICLDTNGREYGFNGRVPDLEWLGQQLADTTGIARTVVISHVPPNDADFDPKLVQPYTQLLRRHPQVALHLGAHIHRFTAGQPFHDGLTYLTAYPLKKRRYHVLTLWGQRYFRLETISYAKVR